MTSYVLYTVVVVVMDFIIVYSCFALFTPPQQPAQRKARRKLTMMVGRSSSVSSSVTSSPFYLSTFMRVFLGTGLMWDAQNAGTAIQVQRTVQVTMRAAAARCHIGAMVERSGGRMDGSYTTTTHSFAANHQRQLVSSFQTPVQMVSEVNTRLRASGLNTAPVSPPVVIAPSLTSSSAESPELPEWPTLPTTPPGSTYEWFSVQLRWMCAALCYFIAAVSMISKRLTNVLRDTEGSATAEAFEKSQNGLKCLETAIICLSLLVYVGDKAYELYMQYFVSVPDDRRGRTQREQSLWQMFIAEIVLVMMVGVGALAGVLLQYGRVKNWITPGSDKEDDHTTPSHGQTSLL